MHEKNFENEFCFWNYLEHFVTSLLKYLALKNRIFCESIQSTKWIKINQNFHSRIACLKTESFCHQIQWNKEFQFSQFFKLELLAWKKKLKNFRNQFCLWNNLKNWKNLKPQIFENQFFLWNELIFFNSQTACLEKSNFS